MSKKWSITSEEVSRANQLAEIMCSELNIKELNISIGLETKKGPIELVYYHDTLKDIPAEPLDLVIGNIKQNKPELAAYLFLKNLHKF